VDRWFNTSLFERDPKKQLDTNFQIRTFPRYLSGVRAEGQSKLDLSLIKQVQMGDRVRMQFRIESYNVLNHPNFDPPNADPVNKAFGTVNSQGGLSREFQLAVSVVF
jgi:hypothetical protein